MAKYNWAQLIADFNDSGLSQTEFCRNNHLNASYFSLKLNQHKKNNRSAFSSVKIEANVTTTQTILVEVGQCKIHYPATLSAQLLADLVVALK